MHGDVLSAEELAAGLGTQLVGREIIMVPQVSSTNDLVRERAAAGSAEGLVILTDEQTAGRGRRSRVWNAPPGSGLLLSLLLRPTWLAPTDAFLLTILTGVAAAEATTEVTGIPALLKWPNDLLLETQGEWRKAGGILVETDLVDRGLMLAVIGCGLNVSWSPDDSQVQFPATNISAAAGQAVPRLPLAQALLRRLDQGYLALRTGQRETLLRRWRELLHTLGKQVRIIQGEQELVGLAEDAAPDGSLLIRDAAGTLHQVMSGDVSLR